MIPILTAIQLPDILTQPQPKPVVVQAPVTWQDNPNHCTDNQWIAAEAPFYCIEKELSSFSNVSTVSHISNDTTNTYTPGNCTFYAKSKRPDLPNSLGNADTWVSRAASLGLPTGTRPKIGAIGQLGMHVVYVQSINGDGSFVISEMNWRGLYVVDTRTISSPIGWRFIY